MKRKLIILALCLIMIFSITLVVSAEEDGIAEDIRESTTLSGSGYSNFSFLFDNNIQTYKKSDGNVTIKLQNEQGIGSLYILFNKEYGEYTITNNETGESITAGQHDFLHEYIDLEKAFGYCTTSVTLNLHNGAVRISELYVFSSGKAPDFVQVWELPLEGKTDILLLSTHGDDEQLFFAGLLPYYTQERGYNVQVAYMTSHQLDTLTRAHEMLNGLWAVGVRNYPVFGPFDDFLRETLNETYREYAARGISKTDIQDYVITQLRRFKPQVVVGHDINGEYYHGMHMVYTDSLIKVLELANDPTQFTDSAEKYGVWDVPKTYLHLYDQNKIVMDYDTPLESWDGLTAFEVTQKYGFTCHESQHWTWFYRWIYGSGIEITKASQIKTYNPCLFGLYRSTVGEDVLKNDFMENIVSYGEQERLEQERLEQERLEQEATRVTEVEQPTTEPTVSVETAPQDQKEQLQQELAQREQLKMILLIVCLVILGVLAVSLVVLLVKLSKQKRQKNRKNSRR